MNQPRNNRLPGPGDWIALGLCIVVVILGVLAICTAIASGQCPGGTCSVYPGAASYGCAGGSCEAGVRLTGPAGNSIGVGVYRDFDASQAVRVIRDESAAERNARLARANHAAYAYDTAAAPSLPPEPEQPINTLAVADAPTPPVLIELQIPAWVSDLYQQQNARLDDHDARIASLEQWRCDSQYAATYAPLVPEPDPRMLTPMPEPTLAPPLLLTSELACRMPTLEPPRLQPVPAAPPDPQATDAPASVPTVVFESSTDWGIPPDPQATDAAETFARLDAMAREATPPPASVAMEPQPEPDPIPWGLITVALGALGLGSLSPLVVRGARATWYDVRARRQGDPTAVEKLAQGRIRDAIEDAAGNWREAGK